MNRMKNRLFRLIRSSSRLLGVPTFLLLAMPATAQLAEPGPANPGVFSRELWIRPAASAEALLDDRTFIGEPDRRDVVPSPIGFDDAGDGFVQRIHGWLAVPTTGAYRFAIASDDDSVLLVSPDGDAASARPVARVTGVSGPMDFSGDGQVSRAITLIKGQRVYLEARHRDTGGADHLMVAWRVPRSAFDRPMPIGIEVEPAFMLEVWNGVAEGDPSTLPVFETKPNRRLAMFEAATSKDIGANIAARLTGDWTAPADGEFVFMLSADDRAWLEVRGQAGDDPRGTAFLASWTAPSVYEGRSGQVTAPIVLQKGDTVSLEARLWQGSGPGHLAIGVRGPGIDQRPINSPLVVKSAPKFRPRGSGSS